MPFFHYSQNNSGGGFDVRLESGITRNVIIEAPDANEADRLAENIGLYFNGCETGQDCDCCGDRWYPQDGWSATDGDPVPSIHGTPIPERDPEGSLWGAFGHGHSPETFVHYLNGFVSGFNADGSPWGPVVQGTVVTAEQITPSELEGPEAWQTEQYNRELEAEALGRPLFPNEY